MRSLNRDLVNPASLPDPTTKVSVVQTHISTVFVADEFVYKVKKPVNFGFLDFSTLEKREYYCHQEVKLNRRLSKDIYLDVLPVNLYRDKYTMTRGLGEVAEFAVKMKRIPDDKLMKSIFARGEISSNHLKRIADVLGGFHENALRGPEIDLFGEPERVKVNTDENFHQVEKYVGTTIPENEFRGIKEWTEDFYKANRGLFMERLRDGRIRDCHGDLHMEHICLTKDLPIIDCIEFNERFRYGDTVSDIAFLLMDLEYHGGHRFSKILWDDYKRAAKEGDVDLLLTFYKVYRAFVRGKVNSFQVDDKAIGNDKKEAAVKRARRYFQLAGSYI